MTEITIDRKGLESELDVKRELSPQQITAIRKGVELGRILRDEHPEIKELYKLQGLSLTKISEELQIELEYGTSFRVAVSGVWYSLIGHKRGFKIEPYEGLIIDEEELRQLGQDHKVKNYYMLGKKLGEKHGQRTYEERRGIHALTSKEKSAIARQSAIARGVTPYKEGELRDAYTLSQNPHYQYSDGKHKGKPIWQKIMDYINANNHNGEPVRTNAESMRAALVPYKKGYKKFT